MNAQESYLFDLQGFIAVPDALDADQLTKLNAIFDQHVATDMAGDKATQRWGGLLNWGASFRDLLDNPHIMPYLEALLGKGFRLDHDYIDLIRPRKSGSDGSGDAVKGPIGTTLHGGSTPFDPAQFYHFQNGRMHNGLTVVAYNLRDVNAGDGGFGCVPGSHKSNYVFPDEWRNLDRLQPFMRAVTGPAGTAVIFTEALTHGTLPWRGTGERRTVFFKYSPNPISWASAYYKADEYEGLSEAQQALLEPPNARFKGRKVSLGRG